MQQGKEEKDIWNGKEEMKLSLLITNIIVYMENSIKSTKKVAKTN